MMHVTIRAEDVERALVEACRRAHAEIVDFTVAPRVLSLAEPWDGHEWLIEFAEPPRAPELFPRVLDEALCRLDPRYRTRRLTDGSMAPPRVIELPAGTFHRWRRVFGQPFQAPRVSGDRVAADGLLAVASRNINLAFIAP
jgi:hypothetical protein